LKKKSGGIKNLFGQSMVYGIGLFLKKAIGFFLIPLYTHSFTQAQYGKLAMIYLLSSALTLFFSLGLNDALMKELSKKNSNEKEIFSRFFYFRLIYVSLFLILLTAHSRWIASFLISPGDASLISLAILTIWLESLFEPAMLILRIQNRSKKFVIINTFRFVINIGLNILFVLHFKFGVAGVILGNLGSSTIFSLILYPEIHKLLTPKSDLSKITIFLKYGLPLLPLCIIIWLGLDLIDRWIIKWILDLGKTGIYTLGYQFGAVMGILVHGFRASWTPFFFQNPDKKQLFADSAITFVRLALILWGILTFFTPEIFQLIVAKKYWGAQTIVPIIAFSYILFGLEEIFTAGFYIKSRTVLLIPIALVPLLINIALNLLLIPYYGIIGAAIATLFSYFLFALFSYIIGNRIFPVEYNIKTILSDLFFGIILLYLTILAGGILYQRLLAFTILCSVFSYKEKTRIKQLYKQIFKGTKT
jgi:O-antigen/teichoic acid export membrane protein